MSHSNWNYVDQDWVDPNSGAALAFETNFNLDLNGDGTGGSVYSTVHTAGSVTFQKHSLLVITPSQSVVAIQSKSPMALANP